MACNCFTLAASENTPICTWYLWSVSKLDFTVGVDVGASGFAAGSVLLAEASGSGVAASLSGSATSGDVVIAGSVGTILESKSDASSCTCSLGKVMVTLSCGWVAERSLSIIGNTMTINNTKAIAPTKRRRARFFKFNSWSLEGAFCM